MINTAHSIEQFKKQKYRYAKDDIKEIERSVVNQQNKIYNLKNELSDNIESLEKNQTRLNECKKIIKEYEDEKLNNLDIIRHLKPNSFYEDDRIRIVTDNQGAIVTAEVKAKQYIKNQ